MNILTCDSSGSFLKLSIKVGVIKKNFFSTESYRHHETFFPMLTSLLKEVSIELKDMDAFGLVSGPGSFTGLRIGYSIFKTLAYALKKKIVTLNVFELLVKKAGLYKEGYLLPIVDSGKRNLYWTLYKNQKRLLPYFEDSIEDFLAILKGFSLGKLEEKTLKGRDFSNFLKEHETIKPIIFGTAKDAFKQGIKNMKLDFYLENFFNAVDTCFFADMIEKKISKQEACFEDPLKLVPFYLKASSAEVMREKLK